MKKLTLVAALASAALLSFSSQAATVAAPFTVTAAFTPVCTVNAAASVIAFTYTAFAAAIPSVALAAPITLNCSRGMGATSSVAFGEGGALAGLIGATNLRYTLTAPVKTFAAGLPATVAPASVGGPDVVTVNFTGGLALQAGGGVTVNPSPVINATDNRTLVVTF